jgi:hypothetical protein
MSRTSPGERAALASKGSRRGMTRAELLALPASVPLETANRALGMGRTLGYDLAKRDQYPCKVLRLGNAYRAITADLLRVLGIEDTCAGGDAI